MSTSLQTVVYWFIDDSQPFWQVWSDISFWFWFPFLWWLVTLSVFSYVFWSSACPLWRSVYSGPLPICDWIVYFLVLIFICFKNKFWILTPYQMYQWICSPIWDFVCSFVCLFVFSFYCWHPMIPKNKFNQECKRSVLGILQGIEDRNWKKYK